MAWNAILAEDGLDILCEIYFRRGLTPKRITAKCAQERQ